MGKAVTTDTEATVISQIFIIHISASSTLLCNVCFCSSLTLSDSVQHHCDLLIVQQALLQKLDEHAVSEATGAQLKGLSILAPARKNITADILEKGKKKWTI